MTDRNSERTKAHDQTGKCAFDAIREMVDALNALENGSDTPVECNGCELFSREDAEQMIHDDPLSVLVRDGWREPGGRVEDGPEEYEILLSTGGPATRIRGTLNKYNEPETARLEVQDWFVPWQEWHGDGWNEETLLAYARCFYYGE